MSCQHPNCTNLIHSICTNHCHWSLCFEHIYEHKSSLMKDFENNLNDLIRSTNEFVKRHDIHREEMNHTKQFDDFQKEFQQISQDYLHIQTNKHHLNRTHFHKIDYLLNEIELACQSTSSDILHHQCPLTTFNQFGLLPSHHVRLCSSNRKLTNLFNHFRSYHHLTKFYSTKLYQAIKSNLDPKSTILFPSNEQIHDFQDKSPCPLNDKFKYSHIRCVPCTTMVTQRFLPIHLKTIHRLRLNQIKEIIENS